SAFDAGVRALIAPRTAQRAAVGLVRIDDRTPSREARRDRPELDRESEIEIEAILGLRGRRAKRSTRHAVDEGFDILECPPHDAAGKGNGKPAFKFHRETWLLLPQERA